MINVVKKQIGNRYIDAPTAQILYDILKNMTTRGIFYRLASSVKLSDVGNADDMQLAFRRAFWDDPLARADRDIVLVWRTEDGQISYIEKASGTVASRWGASNRRRLCTDKEGGLCQDIATLQVLSNADQNATFYRRLVMDHGSLSFWVATVTALRDAYPELADMLGLLNSRDWENAFLVAYKAVHGRLPLKNSQV